MHTVSITSDENGHTHLLLNGQDISSGCYEFSIKQTGGGFPEIHLTLSCANLQAELRAADIEIEDAPNGPAK